MKGIEYLINRCTIKDNYQKLLNIFTLPWKIANEIQFLVHRPQIMMIIKIWEIISMGLYTKNWTLFSMAMSEILIRIW